MKDKKHKCFVCHHKFSNTCVVGTGKFIICLSCLHRISKGDESLEQKLFQCFSEWNKIREEQK